MKPVFLLSTLLFFFFPTIVRADDDTRTVEAEFDRCESTMERVNRDMLRFEEAVGRLKRALDGSKAAVDQETMQSFLKLENRVDYLRGRIDRSAGQRDKIQGDLKSSGATCPSCVTSSVNLYCRNGEMLTREIEKCLAEASALENQIYSRSKTAEQKPGQAAADSSLDASHGAIAEEVKKHKPLLDSCRTKAGKTLWKQCEVNLRRADSLKAAGASDQREQALKLVKLLLDKAIAKCGGK
ncbi:MAG: hypothetical protein JW913_01615 [Chitinispirillaceae bacterium]|nr:hypothetical protein [Chitinispirillaceae bacterium]